MSRHLPSITGLCLGLLAGVLALGLLVQFQLFEDHRLRRLEAAHAAVITELRQAIESQLTGPNDLAASARLLNRFVALPSRRDLVSSVLVLDTAQQTVFEFTGPLLESALPSQVALGRWPEGWRRLNAPTDAGPVLASLRRPEGLYVATPITRPDASVAGLLILGTETPVSLREFMLGGMSPALWALACLFACGLLAVLVAWRLGRPESLGLALVAEGPSQTGATTDAGDAWARLDQSADRLAAAQETLRRIPRSGPGGGDGAR